MCGTRANAVGNHSDHGTGRTHSLMTDNENRSRNEEAEADKRLRQLIDSSDCSADDVRAAIDAGANVNAVDSNGSSILMRALSDGETTSLEIIRLLCDLGADVDFYDENDFCPLAEAFYGHNPAVIECLLQYSANPNVIVERICPGSVLDIAETDLGFHTMEYDHAIEVGHAEEAEHNKRAREAVAAIVELLKAAGAKSMWDMVATEPRTWLVVFARYATGLLTRDGFLDIANVPNVSERFCQQFRGWVSRHFDAWPDNRPDDRPKGFDRAKHNEEGRRLSQEIKRLVGDAVAVGYGCICAEDEVRGIRNTHWNWNISTDSG